MTDLALYGSGGLAREILQVVLDVNEDARLWNVLGFLSDDPEAHGREIHGLPLLGDAGWLEGRRGVHVALAMGSPAAKRRVGMRVAEIGSPFATFVHPLAWVGRRVEIGEGSVLCAGARVTTDVQVGRHVTLNLNCTVGHDAALGDYVTVAPSANVSGAVRVGEGCDLGTGSAIIQGKTLGAWSIIGAGAVVVNDVPANVTSVGAPAKPVKERPGGWHL